MKQFDRITFNSEIMAGQACIRGMRITVALVLNLLSNGRSGQDIIEEYSELEIEDIQQCLKYAAWLATEAIYPYSPQQVA
jgi:uncharacterized protein (DUF433 family)